MKNEIQDNGNKGVRMGRWGVFVGAFFAASSSFTSILLAEPMELFVDVQGSYLVGDFALKNGEHAQKTRVQGAQKRLRTQGDLVKPEGEVLVTSLGPSVGIGALMSVDDFFALYLSADFAYQFNSHPFHRTLTTLSLGTRYTFDVFKYVPYTSIGVGAAYIYTPEFADHRWLSHVMAEFGLNYRFNRSWSIGGEVKYRVFIDSASDYPSQVLFGSRITYHF